MAILALALVGSLIGEWYSSYNIHQPAHNTSYNGPAQGVYPVVFPKDPNDRIANYTGLLAIFNGMLVIIAILQIRLLVLADRTAKYQAAQMKKASDFAETQNLIISSQIEIQQKQHAIGRLQFLATHRPRLIVRNVWIDGLNVGYVLVNTGSTSATVTESHIAVEYTEAGVNVIPLVASGWNDLGNVNIAAGQTLYLSQEIPGDMHVAIMHPEIRRIMTDQHPRGMVGDIYFAGAITYADDAGIARSTVFRRQWIQTSGRFFRVNDPDQEYAD